jgi:hypothetical protein
MIKKSLFYAGNGDPAEISDSMRLQSLLMQLYMASGCSLMSRFALLISLVGLRATDARAPTLSCEASAADAVLLLVLCDQAPSLLSN